MTNMLLLIRSYTTRDVLSGMSTTTACGITKQQNSKRIGERLKTQRDSKRLKETQRDSKR